MRKRKRRRVLVVDDDRGCRLLLRRVLTDMGCDVTGASCGYEALQEASKRPYDLVFTDLHMRGMDGFRLAKSIRALNPGVPIILVTGADQMTTVEKIKNSGVASVVFKPFSLDDIAEIIKKTCAR